MFKMTEKEQGLAKKAQQRVLLLESHLRWEEMGKLTWEEIQVLCLLRGCSVEELPRILGAIKPAVKKHRYRTDSGFKFRTG